MERTKLEIHLWGDPILQKKCRRVEKVDDSIRGLLDEMYLLMRISDGVGLAANQAGLPLQLIVVETQEGTFKLINPEVVKKEGIIEFEEGCLSFPGITCTIRRAARVWVRAFNEEGEPFELEAKGILSVVLQHEIDHVNGIVFIRRIPFFKRLRLWKQLRQIKKRVHNELQ